MEKIYCASDFHIGHYNANYSKIKDFLELARLNADQLILCGDILDLWVRDFKSIQSWEPMRSCYESLIETSEEVHTIYIRGNHDYNIKIPELNIVDYYYQDGIYYTHGWEFDIEQRLGYPLYSWIARNFPSIYMRFFRTPFETIPEYNLYTQQVMTIEYAARRCAEKKEYDYLVFGHTHFPGIKGKIVNCGDFVDSCSYIVIDDGKPYKRYVI